MKGKPGLRSIVFDCERPWTLARWWAETIAGYRLREWSEEDAEFWLEEVGIDRIEDAPTLVIDPTDRNLPTIWFNRVPESKSVKNRVHIDVNLERKEDIDRLVQRGAHLMPPLAATPDEDWAVLLDPEGNEFCAFPPEG